MSAFCLNCRRNYAKDCGCGNTSKHDPDKPWLSTPRRIVSAAIRNGDSIITAPRHADPIMRATAKAQGGIAKWYCKDAEQGFVDQMCDFYSREEAWAIAEYNGQILRDCSVAGTLFSENLY